MNILRHSVSQGPRVLNRCESGTHAHHAQGTAGNSATTTTTPNHRRPSRRTVGGAGVHTTVPSNILARSTLTAPEAPRALAGQRRTDGRAAWNGYSPAATAGPGAGAGWTTASNRAPRPLISTTTSPWPVASRGGPPEQPNVLQGEYHPHHQVHAQGYTNVMLASPSHHPGLQPGRAPPPPNPSAPAPVNDGAAGQHAYAAGSSNAPPSHYPAEMSAPGHLCICHGDYWLAWCYLSWEHYNDAMNSPLPYIRLPCTCPPGLPMGAVLKSCPSVAGHLLTWVHVCTERWANQFRIAAANNYVAPDATSQDAATINATSPSRETGNPQDGREIPDASFSRPGTPTALSRTTQRPFTSPLPRGTSPLTQDIHQPSDIGQSLESFVSPLGGDPRSVPVVQVVTINPSDIAGPSAPSSAPPRGGNRSKRRNPSLIIPPAKRSRRVPQSNPNAPENTGTQVVSTDESLGFGSLNQQPEVQKAMRDLVVAIRAAKFFMDNKPEPNLGTHEANTLTAVASDGLWRGYGTKAKSIYSLFIKVDGKECKCLWCGDVQKGKLQRAVGHFRAKHLGHEPFLCGDAHIGNEACNVRFASYEAMGEHKRRKDNLKTNGKLPCHGCGRSYTSVSNLNRHQTKCGGSQADPERDDDE